MPTTDSDRMHQLKEIREALVRFLWCHWHDSENGEQVNVIVHQFGFTVLYLPIYLVLNDLMACAKELGGTLRIVYSKESTKNDVDTFDKLVNSDLNFLSPGRGAFHLGLSEVPSHERDPEQVLRRYCIKRLPLWGVALKNNPFVNSVKKRMRLNDPQFSEYWQLFESKFSLLSRDDLRKCRLSIYPKGSTVYRLLNEYLGDSGNTVSKAIPITKDNEFEHLLRSDVDVALTLHPWNAVTRASTEHRELEIVFNHLGRPEQFTSVYAKRHTDGARANDRNSILELVLNLIASLINDRVAEIYEAGDERIEDQEGKLHNMASFFCDLLKDNGAVTDTGSCEIAMDVYGQDRMARGCVTCILPTKVALQVLNDSRIYYYDMNQRNPPLATTRHLERAINDSANEEYATNSASEFDPQDIVQQYFPYRWVNEVTVLTDERERMSKCKEILIQADPVLEIARRWSTDPLCDHTRSNKVSSFPDELRELCSYFETAVGVQVPEMLSLNMHSDSLIDDYRDQWKVVHEQDEHGRDFVTNSEKAIENVLGIQVAEGSWTRTDGGRLFFPHETFASAFKHFRSNMGQFSDKRMFLGYIPEFMGEDDLEYGVSFTLIVFAVADGENSVDTGVEESQFAQCEQARKILSGWYGEVGGQTPRRIFTKQEHPSMVSVTYSSAGTLRGVLLNEKLIVEFPQTDGRNLNRNERFWLFTFRTCRSRPDKKIVLPSNL